MSAKRLARRDHASNQVNSHVCAARAPKKRNGVAWRRVVCVVEMKGGFRSLVSYTARYACFDALRQQQFIGQFLSVGISANSLFSLGRICSDDNMKRTVGEADEWIDVRKQMEYYSRPRQKRRIGFLLAM